ncbi:flap endonuclease [Cryptosporidium canis]|uniref:Flap endonuclease n=1 Tax=Cryptosporidium canis TaxID=195482 RepID=A0A9D5DE53_9CRYT|nr:flap endonuclease [Cryptosporidium canis]
MQREASEVNMRRVANKLLLNTIRLRAARRIKGRVQERGGPSEARKDGELVPAAAVQEDSHGAEQQGLGEEGSLSEAPSLFSSEDDEEMVGGGSCRVFKRYGRYGVSSSAEEAEDPPEGAVSYFPVLGFLSERRRLDEMPEVDTNLFAMPILSSSARKLGSRKMTKVEDFSAFLRSSELGSGERRLMDLPLDAEIDPQVFEQLNSKLQYEILVQLRDAWINALRSNAVDTKDNMSQFSNSQMECYLRYLRINQEIEKLKVRMAKECELEQAGHADEDIQVVSVGQIYDPDRPFVQDYAPAPKSSSSSYEDQSEGAVREESDPLHTPDDSTLTGRIIGLSSRTGAGGSGLSRRPDSPPDGDTLTIKGFGHLSKISKKERIQFLQTTSYAKSENTISNPLNTPLFELERLLSVEACQETRGQDKSEDVSKDSVDAERILLLRENVEQLFDISHPTVSNVLGKDDGLIVDVEEGALLTEPSQTCQEPHRGLEPNSHDPHADDESDWGSIEWEGVETIGHQPSKSEIKRDLLSDSFVSDFGSAIDAILGAGQLPEAQVPPEDVEDSGEDLRAETVSSPGTPGDESPRDGHGETRSATESRPADGQEPLPRASGVGDDELLEDALLEEIQRDQETGSGPDAGQHGSFDKSLDEILAELEREHQDLSLEFSKNEVLLNSQVTKEMQFQVCQLLRALGIPWVDSPGEAEAQASMLTRLGVCHGVISDDSDCFIFGARRVLRNFFSGNCIEMYDLSEVKRFLGIDRQEQFYILAVLLGCDYAIGVNGIGPVNAVEVLKAYPDLGDLPLLRDWSMNKLQDPDCDHPGDTPERAEFKRNHANYRHSWVFPPDFPCEDAIHAMRSPQTISNVKPVFGKIDRNSTIELMASQTNLTREKVALIVDPIIQNQQNPHRQTKIDDFLVGHRAKRSSSPDAGDCNARASHEERVASITSKRMKKALRRVK